MMSIIFKKWFIKKFPAYSSFGGFLEKLDVVKSYSECWDAALSSLGAPAKQTGNNARDEICPNCDGTGEIRSYIPGGEWFKCGKCKGTGKLSPVA